MNASLPLRPSVDYLSMLPPSVEHRLKGYGFTQGRIIDAIKEYLKSNNGIEPNAFIVFAVNQFSSSSIVPPLWSPLTPTRNYLSRKGVSDSIVERCLANFRGKKLTFKPESLDGCFIQYCLRAMANDQQTSANKSRTSIPDNWTPSEVTCSQLKSLLNGWPEKDWDIGEYRLYWIEAGGKKDNWDLHFLSYMKKKYGLV